MRGRTNAFKEPLTCAPPPLRSCDDSFQASTSLSVRGEAQRTIAPDEASVYATVSGTADSKAAAVSDVQTVLGGILTDLAALGGAVLTAQSTRSSLTWSAQSMQTYEEHPPNKVTGESGPTGRHQASTSLLITVRDFSLLPEVSRTVIGRDSVEVHSVSWSVDQDNAQWALVRADAIRAALLQRRDYAAALGGTVVSVDHVADAGLLGGENHGRGSGSFGRPASGGGGQMSLDPAPQILDATIEARFTAVVSALPAP